MQLFILASLIFFLGWMVHFILWKIRVPKFQTRSLLRIFLGGTTLSLFVLWNLARLNPNLDQGWVLRHASDYLHIFIYVVSLMLFYIITYSALEVDSPSLVMLTHIIDAGPKGLKKEVFDKTMNDDLPVKPRVNDLLRDGLAELKNGKYIILEKGKFVRYLILHRKLMGITQKGG